MNTVGLPGSLADWGPAALSAVAVAGYLVVGEPFVGHVLHRRFEGRLRTDPGARRSFARTLRLTHAFQVAHQGRPPSCASRGASGKQSRVPEE